MALYANQEQTVQKKTKNTLKSNFKPKSLRMQF